MRRLHPIKFQEYLKSEELLKKTKQTSTSKKGRSRSSEAELFSQKQNKIDTFFQKRVLPVPIDREEFINGIVRMIVNGKPLSIMEDEGFLQIVRPILTSLNLCLNRFNIYNFVHERYLRMHNALQELLKDRLICLKVDCATRMERAFIGINLQFVHKGKIAIFTLSAIELQVRHTGSNLKKVILEELQKWNISPSQIYSITSDNGANIVKAIELADEESRKIELDHEGNDDADDRAINLANTINEASWDENFIICK